MEERIDEALQVDLPPLRLAATLHQRRSFSGSAQSESQHAVREGPRIVDIAAGGECTLLLIDDGLDDQNAWILPDD